MDRAGLAVSDASRDAGRPSALPAAARVVQGLTGDMYRRLAAQPGNLVCSPYSVAVALGMTRNGARGTTAAEMDDVLHTTGAAELNDGLNAIGRLLEGRAGRKPVAGNRKAAVELDVANSLWGQVDTRWEQDFLDALARSYGAGIRLVDYRAASERARELINEWTAAQTRDKITEIIPPGVLSSMTRLVLVNAIYLKANWLEPFSSELTSRRPFRTADGSRVEVDMMSEILPQAAYASGSGWQAVRLTYVGGELAMAVVLPDEGRLASVEASLDGPELGRLLDSFEPMRGLRVELPRWKFRLSLALKDHLGALGMPTAFDPSRADFSGMTREQRLYISHVLHQAYVAVDEDGTEAAAATAVVMREVSAPLEQLVFTADRPFLFVIYDVETVVPLFIGRVNDPTA